MLTDFQIILLVIIGILEVNWIVNKICKSWEHVATCNALATISKDKSTFEAVMKELNNVGK